jgi:hypothetical protein
MSEEFNLPPAQQAALKVKRERVCRLLAEHVVPRLESLVQLDYRMWQDATQRSGLTSSGGDGSATEAAPSTEHIGSETVETLAQCYAFLLECRHLGWPAVEAKATRPYSYTSFWKQANATYRRFAMFNLAHVLHVSCDISTA